MNIVLTVFLSALLLGNPLAYADIPDSYIPVVIDPFGFNERLIDLTAVTARAKTEGRPILLYMGAKDCPPCRDYEQFLIKHRNPLGGTYSPLLLVEVRSWLKGPKLVLKVADKRYSLQEFKVLVGDGNKVFSWPYWWLLSADLRQIKQLPVGASHYLDVERHKALLRFDKP